MSTAHDDSDALINDSLHRLEIISAPVDAVSGEESALKSRLGVLHEGYGFRPASGTATPSVERAIDSPLPDRNGLGWPGEPIFIVSITHRSFSCEIKSN